MTDMSQWIDWAKQVIDKQPDDVREAYRILVEHETDKAISPLLKALIAADEALLLIPKWPSGAKARKLIDVAFESHKKRLSK